MGSASHLLASRATCASAGKAASSASPGLVPLHHVPSPPGKTAALPVTVSWGLGDNRTHCWGGRGAGERAGWGWGASLLFTAQKQIKIVKQCLL